MSDDAAAGIRLVQPRTKDDVATMARLDRVAFAAHPEDCYAVELLEAFLSCDPPAAAASIVTCGRARCERVHDRRALWAAIAVEESSGEAVGFALADPSHSRIAKLCVAPKYRRRGVGSALLAAAVAALKARRAVAVSLYVRVGNAAADALYRRRGFAVDCVEADFYGPGAAGARMLRDCF